MVVVPSNVTGMGGGRKLDDRTEVVEVFPLGIRQGQKLMTDVVTLFEMH